MAKNREQDQDKLNRENDSDPLADRTDLEVQREFDEAVKLIKNEVETKSLQELVKEYDDVTGDFETHSLSHIRVLRSDDGVLIFWAVCDLRAHELLLIALDTTLVKREIQLYLNSLENSNDQG